MSIQTQYFPFGGGLNTQTPPLSTKPGELIDCINYECLQEGGYQRISGYERVNPIVPGDGPVLGVHTFRGDIYAVRDDAGAGKLYWLNDGVWTQITTHALSAEGTYRFTNHNFYAQDSMEDMFMVNGKNKAVRVRDKTAHTITTGAPNDAPTDVEGHKNHLFLTIESSVMSSAIGNPMNYDAINGASEIGVGDVVNQIEVAQGALIIGAKSGTHVLYGDSSATWQLAPLNKTGVVSGTMAQIGGTLVALDTTGIMNLRASEAYGNFSYSSISEKVRNDVEAMRLHGVNVATTNRKRNQYRMFNGKRGLYVTFYGGEVAGITKVLFNHDVVCLTTALDNASFERSYFGSTDGYVYELDTANKFAGENINDYMVLSFHSHGLPTQRKRFRLIECDVRVAGTSSPIFFRVFTDYAAGFSSIPKQFNPSPSGGGFWDFGQWDQMTYDAIYFNKARSRVNVVGENMAIAISSTNDNDGQHAIFGATLHYSSRRLGR